MVGFLGGVFTTRNMAKVFFAHLTPYVFCPPFLVPYIPLPSIFFFPLFFQCKSSYLLHSFWYITPTFNSVIHPDEKYSRTEEGELERSQVQRGKEREQWLELRCRRGVKAVVEAGTAGAGFPRWTVTCTRRIQLHPTCGHTREQYAQAFLFSHSLTVLFIGWIQAQY